jgi:cytochrome c553
MAYLVRYLPNAYLLEIATYYSKLRPAVRTEAKSTATAQALARGEALVRNGDPAKTIPACDACHGKALTGMQPAIPGLIGLDSDYILAQLGAWQTGVRHAQEPDCMAKIAAKLSGTDIAAVGAWLASQPVSPTTMPAPDKRQPLPLACGSQPR